MTDNPLGGGGAFGGRTADPRGWSFARRTTHEVHGAGCRFVLADGREVDVDLVEGEAALNAWRLQSFASSIGKQVSEEDAAGCLEQGITDGRLREIKPGWYAEAKTSA